MLDLLTTLSVLMIAIVVYGLATGGTGSLR
jgi:hypothetical protein